MTLIKVIKLLRIADILSVHELGYLGNITSVQHVLLYLQNSILVSHGIGTNYIYKHKYSHKK